ncbi:MAG: hypothetical protein C5S44_02115 [Candidatus Methanocomedens sp.]|jgi:hypothetical protein|nr:MAG: hypothetical protein C5S45_04575 [ANME-2 cluster archaeon]KAF5424207.1 MAG: hypothetical protein C5S44_02115 [ANME-2 cluster archaeon]MRG77378.1 hypothetical protein [ANME-2 cluster archaeon]
MYYFAISVAAFAVVAFLTLRDIRIFRRTRLESYRKGAMKGMAAMFLVFLGGIVVQVNPEFGLLLVLLGMFINKKGQREDVFGGAKTADRFLGKTEIKN